MGPVLLSPHVLHHLPTSRLLYLSPFISLDALHLYTVRNITLPEGIHGLQLGYTVVGIMVCIISMYANIYLE